jgi:hypothetical protein
MWRSVSLKTVFRVEPDANACAWWDMGQSYGVHLFVELRLTATIHSTQRELGSGFSVGDDDRRRGVGGLNPDTLFHEFPAGGFDQLMGSIDVD